MFGLSEIKQKLYEIEKIIEMSEKGEVGKLQKVEKDISLLRRDVNDLHTIFMLKDASAHMPKKNRIVFIGTGQINENVVHAYIHLQQAIANKEIEFNGELLFLAVSETEERLFANFGFPCRRWHYQTSLAYYLLETKVVVLSSHQYSFWGNNLLNHCISGAIRVELWHGLPAKNIGLSGIPDNMEFHFFARLLQDSVMTKHVCIQNSNQDVVQEYRQAFPFAKQHVTGDSRVDILFNEAYRQQFLKNKPSKAITEWLKRSGDVLRVLFTPTYRQSKQANEVLYEKICEMLQKIDSKKVAVAIKLHVGISLPKKQYEDLRDLANKNGHLLIDYHDEVYSVFNDFDAMIADYSSIRVDFALTGKPILLWCYDLKEYKASRLTGRVDVFDKLDCTSEYLPDSFDEKILTEAITQDVMREERQQVVNNCLGLLVDGKASSRSIQAILEAFEQ